MVGMVLPFIETSSPVAFGLGVGIFVVVRSSPNPPTFHRVVTGIVTAAAAAAAAVVHAGYLQPADHFLHHKVGEGVLARTAARRALGMDAGPSSSVVLAPRGVRRRLIAQAVGAEGVAASERARILQYVLADRAHQAGVGRRQEERRVVSHGGSQDFRVK